MKWLLRALLKPIICAHLWEYHVRARPAPGEPETWRKCRICGKIVVESRAKRTAP